jgi:CTP:molybdopterin cytidylyltransferase MocA
MRIGAVILAAGKASRFGAPKQLLEIDGEPLVDRACRTARDAGCHPVLRVLGANADEILKRPCPAGVETRVHLEWEDGMGASLAAGVAGLLEMDGGLEAIVVLLADQPLVSSGLLAEMRSRLSPAGVVLCRYDGTSGPPALFAAAHFDALRRLSGDRGARAVAAGCDAATVDFPAGCWDIDSLEVWERFLARG